MIRLTYLKYYYPKVEYSESRILKDTKSILDQNFVEKYCKLMQVALSFYCKRKHSYLGLVSPMELEYNQKTYENAT
jgi:hypothetical protein